MHCVTENIGLKKYSIMGKGENDGTMIWFVLENEEKVGG